MQGGRRGGDSFFDPFAGLGGFGGHGSLISSVFGGRDPFDDPFFTSPFVGSPFRSMFEPSFFGPGGSPFMNPPSRFLERHHHMPHAQPHPPRSNIQTGPIIQELDSDDEKEENGGAMQRKDNPGKHSRLGKEPFVEYPDDDAEERNRQVQFRNDCNLVHNMPSQPQSQSFTFHSSAVSYGGGNGSYYTKSSTRRTGSDGVAFEEQKEADSTTGQAFHQVSRGLHNKAHTLTRNLNSDGKVDSMQTLHNLNQDELAGFEKAWTGKAQKHLPGVSERLSGLTNSGAINDGQDVQTSRGGWALPSTEHPQPQPHPNPKRVRRNAVPVSNPTASKSHHSGRRI